MNYLISGGAKNGKSSFAEEVVAAMSRELGQPVFYVATMIPHDEEDRARIQRHRRGRAGKGFLTVECGYDLLDGLKDKNGIFLVDSVTALLANEMFLPDGSTDRNAPYKLADELARLALAKKNVVFVSDFIYSDAETYGELTEAYKKGLALIDRTLAEVCDRVVEVTFGIPTFYKE